MFRSKKQVEPEKPVKKWKVEIAPDILDPFEWKVSKWNGRYFSCEKIGRAGSSEEALTAAKNWVSGHTVCYIYDDGTEEECKECL